MSKGTPWSAEEKEIASRNLTINDIYNLFLRNEFNRSRENIRRWRNTNGMGSLKKSDLITVPKIDKKPKERKRFPVGLRDWLMFG